ncbi:shikimate dehydrogenase [Mesorhizobium sp. 8]|uniref:shikimate dehydrogenase family protein n=1 Tax=Mesorhizobium sp. 8 TaxID=2584466 RepID=UPI00112246AA|nr:shikimate dehydrogenase [Mesorhizobium sp. 8]QDC02327.1 shikimate dehydrogenase [Mesorhizobium sp. 8]
MSIAEPKHPKADSGDRVRLGLIGDNIARSRSPDLHRLAGKLCGLDVSYELFVPPDMGSDFDAVFDACRASGVRGLNVTYPYKETVVERIRTAGEDVQRIGSVNTVVFGERGPIGHNTDHSGFLAAYRATFGQMQPGRTALVGAGGVGKAVAFGLAALGAREIAVIDRDEERARGLAEAVAAYSEGDVSTTFAVDAREALRSADGIVNCTPLGMVGYPGSAVPLDLLGSQRWAFEAVYTPVDTPFKLAAEASGLKVLSGFELFFHQGVDAFRIFTGLTPDLTALRRLLVEAASN